MTLYRPTDTCTDMENAIKIWVVPVEPCEHTDEDFPNGHIDKHKADDKYGNWEWCPGAGVGEETP